MVRGPHKFRNERNIPVRERRHIVVGRVVKLISLLGLITLILTSNMVWASEAVKLRVGRGWGTDEIWNKLVAEFQAEHPHIQIELDPVGWNMEKVISAVVAGQSHDIVFAVIEQALAIKQEGFLRSLNPFIEKDPDFQEYIEDVHPNIWNVFNYDGEQFYIPFDWNNMVMWYNKRRYSEAGLIFPTRDWTWNEFLANARKLTKRSADGEVEAGGYTSWDSGASFFGDAPWYFSNGGRYLNEDWSASAFDSPQNIETVEFLRALKWDHEVTGPDHAMFGAGTWPWPGLVHGSETGREDWDIQLWPRKVQQTTVIGIGGHGIASTSRYPQEAWEFIKFISTRDALMRFALSEGVPNRMYPRTSVIMSDEFLSQLPEHGRLFFEAMNSVNVVPAPPEFPDLQRVMNETVPRCVMNAEISPLEAVKEAHRLMDSILSQRQ